MKPYDDEVTRCNAVYVAAKTAYENANPGDEAKLKKKMDAAKKDYDEACAARQTVENNYKVDVDELVQKLNSENNYHKNEWFFLVDSSSSHIDQKKVHLKLRKGKGKNTTESPETTVVDFPTETKEEENAA